MTDRPRIDYTARDFSSIRDALLEYAQDRLPAWTDHSDNDLGVVLVDLFAYLGDAMFFHQDRIAQESYLATARERRSVVNLLRLIGYELRPPLPSSADLTLLFKSDATGTVLIGPGTAFRTAQEVTGAVIDFQYVRESLSINLDSTTALNLLTRAQILSPLGAKDQAILGPLLQDPTYKVWAATLPVIQVDAAPNEVIGSSDGTGGQRFALSGTPLIDDSLKISVNEGGPSGIAKAWTRVDTLLNSLGTDETYTVRRDENDVAWIEFGDGRYGRPPRRGRDNILASYRVGGGTKGNVRSVAITKLVTSINGLKVVFNAGAASAGADREDIAEAAERGPQQFRSSGRAVTEADYEFHAKSFGVAKARAESTGLNLVNLCVAPAGGGAPSDTLISDLEKYFDGKRIATMQLKVFGPTYVDVRVDADVWLDPRFNKTQVLQKIDDALGQLWSFDAVDFGETLYISKIYEAIEALDGVTALNVRTFVKKTDPDPTLPPPAGMTATPRLPLDGSLRFGTHEIPRVTSFCSLAVVQGTPHA